MTCCSEDQADLFAPGYNFDLSKRATVCTNGVYIKNKGVATPVVSAGPALGAGTKSRGVDGGIRHSF